MRADDRYVVVVSKRATVAAFGLGDGTRLSSILNVIKRNLISSPAVPKLPGYAPPGIHNERDGDSY